MLELWGFRGLGSPLVPVLLWGVGCRFGVSGGFRDSFRDQRFWVEGCSGPACGALVLTPHVCFNAPPRPLPICKGRLPKYRRTAGFEVDSF